MPPYHRTRPWRKPGATPSGSETRCRSANDASGTVNWNLRDDAPRYSEHSCPNVASETAQSMQRPRSHGRPPPSNPSSTHASQPRLSLGLLGPVTLWVPRPPHKDLRQDTPPSVSCLTWLGLGMLRDGGRRVTTHCHARFACHIRCVRAVLFSVCDLRGGGVWILVEGGR